MSLLSMASIAVARDYAKRDQPLTEAVTPPRIAVSGGTTRPAVAELTGARPQFGATNLVGSTGTRYNKNRFQL